MVKITKLSECENPKYKSAAWDGYVLGINNGDVSLPIEYQIEGELLAEIKEGKSIHVERTSRNGIKSFGYFTSSVVSEVIEKEGGRLVKTGNSVYFVEEI